jgi:hypothetical protein
LIFPIASDASLLLQLLRSHSLNQKPLDAVLGVLILVTLKLYRSGDVLVGFELCLSLMMEVALGCNMCEKV